MGFVNGTKIPTDGIQDARLTGMNDFEGIIGAKNYISKENKEWIKVTGKATKKVVPGKRDQFGKTKKFGKIDRSNKFKHAQFKKGKLVMSKQSVGNYCWLVEIALVLSTG